MPESPRPWQVLLLGATGFCGSFLAKELDARRVVWAAAARRPRPMPGDAPCVHLDLSDHGALTALVRRADVVLSALGPALTVAEPVLAACVAARTHYLDITGETPWVAQMVARWSGPAQAAGLRLVCNAGFESIPCDLGVLDLARWHRERGVGLRRVLALAEARAGVNGGTLASVEALANASLYREARGDDAGPWARFHPELRTWSGRHPTAGVDSWVLRRSAALAAAAGAPYGEKFAFELRWRATSAAGALARSAGVALLHRLFEDPRSRRFLLRLGPRTGEGPRSHKVHQGFFSILLRAQAEDGRWASVFWRGAGDPGSLVTARLAVAAALRLRERAEQTDPTDFGVLTPARGLGLEFLRLLPPSISYALTPSPPLSPNGA